MYPPCNVARRRWTGIVIDSDDLDLQQHVTLARSSGRLALVCIASSAEMWHAVLYDNGDPVWTSSGADGAVIDAADEIERLIDLLAAHDVHANAALIDDYREVPSAEIVAEICGISLTPNLSAGRLRQQSDPSILFPEGSG